MGMSNMRSLWVLSGPALPCGARESDEIAAVLGPAREGTRWLDVCVLGQHLPQMYPVGEAHELTAEACPQFGLCPDCLGFGDMGSEQPTLPWELARGIDEVSNPCPNCGGTGRPALRVKVTRSRGSTVGSITPLPHAYVPMQPGTDPLLLAAFEIPDGMCLACGMPENGKGPRDEALHTG